MSVLRRGPKYVRGVVGSGRVVLHRDDDSTDEAPMWMFSGVSIADNGDGTATLTFADEE